MIHAPRRALRLFKNRQTLILLVALLTLMLAPGMRGRLFRARELTDDLPVGSPSLSSAHLQLPRLVHLDAGSRLEGQSAPQGWSHLVIKSVPSLATGDLDTVSSQAFDTARRIRPLLVADIRRSEPESGSVLPARTASVIGLSHPRRWKARAVRGRPNSASSWRRWRTRSHAPTWPPQPRLLPWSGRPTPFSSRDHIARSSHVRPCWWTCGAASCGSSSGA